MSNNIKMIQERAVFKMADH